MNIDEWVLGGYLDRKIEGLIRSVSRDSEHRSISDSDRISATTLPPTNAIFLRFLLESYDRSDPNGGVHPPPSPPCLLVIELMSLAQLTGLEQNPCGQKYGRPNARLKS